MPHSIPTVTSLLGANALTPGTATRIRSTRNQARNFSAWHVYERTILPAVMWIDSLRTLESKLRQLYPKPSPQEQDLIDAGAACARCDPTDYCIFRFPDYLYRNQDASHMLRHYEKRYREPPSATVARKSTETSQSLERVEKETRFSDDVFLQIAAFSGHRIEDFLIKGKLGKQLRLYSESYIMTLVGRKKKLQLGDISSSDLMHFTRVLRLQESVIKLLIEEARMVDAASDSDAEMMAKLQNHDQVIRLLQNFLEAEGNLPAYLKLSMLDIGLYKVELSHRNTSAKWIL